MQIEKAVGLNVGDAVRAWLKNSYIVDYGIVTAVNGGRVDVKHAVKAGKKIIESKNVEVLFPSSKNVSVSWELQAGDVVLLVGSRQYVREAGTLMQPEEEIKTPAYARITMKAIPVGKQNEQATNKIVINADGVTIETGGEIKIKGNVIIDGECEITKKFSAAGGNLIAEA